MIAFNFTLIIINTILIGIWMIEKDKKKAILAILCLFISSFYFFEGLKESFIINKKPNTQILK